jgi:hypothetical protein
LRSLDVPQKRALAEGALPRHVHVLPPICFAWRPRCDDLAELPPSRRPPGDSFPVSSQTITIIVATFGATTGAISLLRQWWSERFRLVFERAVLRYEPEAIEQLAGRSSEQLQGTFLDFEVEVELLNRGSGTGSIEKPRLELALPGAEPIVVFPDTQARRSEPLPGVPGGSRIWIKRFGNSWTVAPHERLDDALTYVVEFQDGQKLRRLLGEFDSVSFFHLYRDHRGRRRSRRST